jgi:adenine-specific DNA-methyltransferase
MGDVIKECVRIVRPGGSICFEVGNHMVGPNRPRPLAFLLDPIFSQFEETDEIFLRNAIVWHFQHGLHAQRRFSGRYETVLWYTKGPDYVFNLNEVRVPQKYPGKRHYKGPNKGKPSGNPQGKNPGDVWCDIPNVKANHVEKTEHPCQFPVALVKRLILALTNEGDLVVDPFMGVGTTAIAALQTNRRSAGCDAVAAYTATARRRVRLAMRGELRTRKDSPIYVPRPNLSVAVAPEGFRAYNGVTSG